MGSTFKIELVAKPENAEAKSLKMHGYIMFNESGKHFSGIVIDVNGSEWYNKAYRETGKKQECNLRLEREVYGRNSSLGIMIYFSGDRFFYQDVFGFITKNKTYMEMLADFISDKSTSKHIMIEGKLKVFCDEKDLVEGIIASERETTIRLYRMKETEDDEANRLFRRLNEDKSTVLENLWSSNNYEPLEGRPANSKD